MEQGLNVWMDVDKMEGSILEAMARAVEDARVVLVCYSEKYKDSQNCRTGKHQSALRLKTCSLHKHPQKDQFIGQIRKPSVVLLNA